MGCVLKCSAVSNIETKSTHILPGPFKDQRYRDLYLKCVIFERQIRLHGITDRPDNWRYGSCKSQPQRRKLVFFYVFRVKGDTAHPVFGKYMDIQIHAHMRTDICSGCVLCSRIYPRYNVIGPYFFAWFARPRLPSHGTPDARKARTHTELKHTYAHNINMPHYRYRQPQQQPAHWQTGNMAVALSRLLPRCTAATTATLPCGFPIATPPTPPPPIVVIVVVVAHQSIRGRIACFGPMRCARARKLSQVT